MSIEEVTQEDIDKESSPIYDQLLAERKDPFVTASHLRVSISEAHNWEPKGPEDDYWCGWYSGRVDTPEQELHAAALGRRPGGDEGDREVLPRRPRIDGTRTGRIPAGPTARKRQARSDRAAKDSGGSEAAADGAGATSGTADRVPAATQEGS